MLVATTEKPKLPPRIMPEMGGRGKANLTRAGLIPDEWVSATMLATYWGVTLNEVRQAVFRKKLPASVEINNRRYYPKELTLSSWKPKRFEKILEKEALRKLGLPNGIQPAELTPKARTQATYLKALSDRVSIEEWKLIIERAIKDAISGNHRARQWLSNYLIGTPIQRIAADLKVTEERFSKAKRGEAVKLILGGLLGDSTVIDAVDPNGAEVDGSATEGEPVMDARTSE